ncbi:MAG: adenine deaminase [Rikenellaceae bacterium]
MQENFIIEGQVVDILAREIFEGSITVEDGVIAAITKKKVKNSQGYIMPGFVDSHIHIESSMLTPKSFGIEAIKSGTVAVVSDPHEIANVMGIKGIDYMKESAEESPIKTFFTIPSCVPATPLDVAGGEITTKDVERMAESGEFVALSEMMNVGGVLSQNKEIISKIEIALRNGLPVDGHAPMLSGKDLEKYVDFGINTDHESSSLSEATEKIDQEMKILIREGSACKNYETLKTLIGTNPEEVMFCSDDLHADDLQERGHISYIAKRALEDGFDLFDILNIASTNPIEHYDLSVGTLQEGDSADFIVVEDLKEFETKQVYIDGELRYNIDAPTSEPEPEIEEEIVEDKRPKLLFETKESVQITPQPKGFNNFRHRRVALSALSKEVTSPIAAIEVIPGEVITNKYIYKPTKSHDNLESDIENDLLKIVYINRYNNGTPQVAYCKGFGLKRGAMASTISHDSHNIIAIGCSDIELSVAINNIIDNKGGLCVCDGLSATSLPLPVCGIMSEEPCAKVASQYKEICEVVKSMGTTLDAPFMTLSFMSLCVIPTIKIGEQGLFDVEKGYWVK